MRTIEMAYSACGAMSVIKIKEGGDQHHQEVDPEYFYYRPICSSPEPAKIEDDGDE